MCTSGPLPLSPENTLLCWLTAKPSPQGTDPDQFGMPTRAAHLLSFSSQRCLIRVLLHFSHHNICRKASNTLNNVLKNIGDFWCQTGLKVLMSSSTKPEKRGCFAEEMQKLPRSSKHPTFLLGTPLILCMWVIILHSLTAGTPCIFFLMENEDTLNRAGSLQKIVRSTHCVTRELGLSLPIQWFLWSLL